MDEAAGAEFEEAFPGMFLVAYRVTHRVLGDVTRAEDAAAEALARALVSWRRVGRMEHRDGWVARVGKEALRTRLGPTQEVSLVLD